MRIPKRARLSRQFFQHLVALGAAQSAGFFVARPPSGKTPATIYAMADSTVSGISLLRCDTAHQREYADDSDGAK